jgi:hypothetical protein
MKFKSKIKNALGQKQYQKVVLAKSCLTTYSSRVFRNNRSIAPQSSIIDFIKIFSVKENHTFFGYYDITPFSEDNRRILASATPKKSISSAKTDLLIGYFDIKNEKMFHLVDTTELWCWQMGCRLQWFPRDENELIIYNTMIEGSYGSIVQNIKTKKIVARFCSALYALDSEAKNALTLNFSRLNRFRPGYGYHNVEDRTINDQIPVDDGIWLINLDNGDAKLIISLKQLSETEPSETMYNAHHYVNHLSFNPSGDRFLFFHLWSGNGRRKNRLITSDLNGENWYILESNSLVSHYTWKSNNEILATVLDDNGNFQYKLYRDKSTDFDVIGPKSLIADGHPTYSPEKQCIITDTYPDKYGEQYLILYENEPIELHRFYHPPKFRGEIRCDLHPRWDRHGKHVCVDAISSSLRSMHVIGLKL